MPSYDYECDICKYQQEEVHGMMEEPQIKCAVCGGPCKKVILVAPAGNVACRTLGSLADKNRSKMSDDEYQHRIEEQRTKKEGGADLPDGMERKTPKPQREERWYDKHTSKSVKEVAKLTPKQTEEYVHHGK